MKSKIILVLFLKIWTIQALIAQNEKVNNFFSRPDSLNKKRLYGLIGAGVGGYAATVLVLNDVWYSDYPRSKFHYFNDNGEWLEMDKACHTLITYNESALTYEAFRWTGMKNKNAVLCGMASGTLFQTTLEILDGYSTGWGFSWGDMGANLGGCALFGVQQAFWEEQKILLKASNFPKKYSKELVLVGNETTSVAKMVEKLYGEKYTHTLLKDYNAINCWLSVNPRSFAKNSKFPAWLNIAVGYSAENVFGALYNLPPANTTAYPRYRQYFLSLDIDLSRIKTKSKFLNAVFRTINFVKIPAPGLEYNSLKQFKFHPFMF